MALNATLIYISRLRVSFNPFSITMARGWLVLGIVLIICGCTCLKLQWYGEGWKEGSETKEEPVIEESITEQI